MPAFIKLGSIEGESTDKQHPKWILVESISAPVNRTIPQGAKDTMRTKGQTVVGDVRLVRLADKSTPKLIEACAKGIFFPEAELHLCSTIKGKAEPYMKYKLSDVIVTGHSFHGTASGEPLPSEEVSLGFTKAEWSYVTLDPQTGENKGTVATSYNPGTGD